MRGFGLLLIALGVLLAVAGCAGGTAAPIATAVPLAATATPRPLPTGAVPTLPAADTPTAVAPTTSATPMPTAIAPPRLSKLDDLLAQRTVESFVSRLNLGKGDSALALFATDAARESEVGRLLSGTAGTEARLAKAALLEMRRATASSYEARILLHWRGQGGESASQTLTARLVRQDGLWLIDDLILGEVQAPTPAPTPRATSRHSGSGGQMPGLSGKLVFQTSNGGNVYVINADGTGLRRLTDGLDPVWSPDGTQVALSRWREPRGVWIVELDGSGERRLFDWSETRTPAWSPDGSQIAFVRQYGGRLDEVERCFWKWCFTLPPDPHWVLGVLNVADGQLTEPPASEVSLAPTWSPDGSRLVYHGRQGLMWTDLADNSSGHLNGSSGWDTSPQYSPDGSQIVFMGRVHTQWEILVMNADGSGRRQLTHSGSQGGEPRHSVAPTWSPDGRQIAFLSNREGPWRIYVMDADGSQQRSMFGSELDGLGLHYGFASERVLSWSR